MDDLKKNRTEKYNKFILIFDRFDIITLVLKMFVWYAWKVSRTVFLQYETGYSELVLYLRQSLQPICGFFP